MERDGVTEEAREVGQGRAVMREKAFVDTGGRQAEGGKPQMLANARRGRRAAGGSGLRKSANAGGAGAGAVVTGRDIGVFHNGWLVTV